MYLYTILKEYINKKYMFDLKYTIYDHKYTLYLDTFHLHRLRHKNRQSIHTVYKFCQIVSWCTPYGGMAPMAARLTLST